MKIANALIAAAAAIVFATVAVPCCGGTDAAAEVRAGQSSRAALRIEGMTCGACATAVKMVLRKLDGVKTVEVSYANKRAIVTYDGAKVTPEQMVKTVEDALPYDASVE